MPAVWLRFRAELRAHWRATLALALLVGVATGGVLTAIAGARRTSSLVDRYTGATRSNDAFLELAAFGEAADTGLLDAIEHLPEVEALGRLAPVAAFPESAGYVPFLAAVDGKVGRAIDRYPIVSGRRPDPHAVAEVLLSEDVARRLHVGAGDRIVLRSFTAEQAALLEEAEEVPPAGPDVTLTVVGIARTGSDLASRPGDITISLLTPAFYEHYHGRISMEVSLAEVRLRGGPDAVPEFARRVRELGGAGISIEPADAGEQILADSFAVLTTGLGIFAVVAGLAALVALTVVLGRHALIMAADDPTLSAVGMTRWQRSLAGAAPAVLPAFGGALLGVVAAVCASPLMPIGLAGRAEPDPGFDVDVPVVALGGLVAVVLVIVVAGLVAWLEAGRRTGNGRAAARPRVSLAVGRWTTGFGPTATTGVRMALEPGRGRTAVPVRPALAGTAAGIAAVIGVLGFGAALDRLVDTPHRYGWGWDVNVVDPDVDALRRDPEVAAVAVGRFQVPLVVEDRPLFAVGVRDLAGDIAPTVVEGHAARAADEIVLGTDTLARIDRGVGDTVEVEGPAGARRFRVVGRGVLPAPDDPLPLADGAALTYEGLGSLGLADGSDEDPSYEQHLVRWKPGVDRDAARARLAREYDVIAPTAPPEVDKLTQVEALPQLLAVFLASIAVLAVGYAVVTGVHRRRRDFAILETIGFVNRQVSGAVAWQTSTIAVIGLTIGIPLGLIVGRWTWALVADGLGVATDPAVPVLALVLAAPVALLVANAIAFVPGRIAARTKPAAVLRSE